MLATINSYEIIIDLSSAKEPIGVKRIVQSQVIQPFLFLTF